jgi:hypothetical protein
LVPTEFPIIGLARSALPVVVMLKLAELMPPIAKGLLGVSEPAKATPLVSFMEEAASSAANCWHMVVRRGSEAS